MAWRMTPGPMFHTYNCQLAQTTKSPSIQDIHLPLLGSILVIDKKDRLGARDACSDLQGFVISSTRIKFQRKPPAVDPMSNQTADD